jgi:hypothetical protein
LKKDSKTPAVFNDDFVFDPCFGLSDEYDDHDDLLSPISDFEFHDDHGVALLETGGTPVAGVDTGKQLQPITLHITLSTPQQLVFQ